MRWAGLFVLALAVRAIADGASVGSVLLVVVVACAAVAAIRAART
jgi:hypothetical protein